MQFSRALRVLLAEGVTRNFLVHVGPQEEHPLQRESRELCKKKKDLYNPTIDLDVFLA
jgi:hypothetical protein